MLKDFLECILTAMPVIAAAVIADFIIAKKKGYNKEAGKKTLRMTIISVLSAIAIVLMLFEFPLPFLPSFYKLDFSELPVIIGAFTLGPVAGVVIEALKIALNLLINGTTTAFVGEFANFIIGCSFIVPASIIYFAKKTKKNAVIGLISGTLICALAGCLLNAYVLLPKYAEVFHMPVEALIGMGTEKNAAIDGMFTFCLFATAPLNLIKCVTVSIITMLTYKKISSLLKGEYYEKYSVEKAMVTERK